jgi:hypothetical protein
MPSNYSAFDVLIDNGDGTQTVVPNAVVEARDFTDPEAVARIMPDLLADTSGQVSAGSLNVGAGSNIRFTWKDETSGRCGYAEATTT